MKSEDETSVDLDIKLTDSIFTEHAKEYNVMCVNGNEAFDYCFNQNCPNSIAFLCGNRKCKCRQQHKVCPKADLDFAIQHVNQKLIDTTKITTKIKENVEKSFDQIIDSLSQVRDNILTQIDEKLKFSMLHEVQKDFIHAISKKGTNYFNSKESAKLWNAINKKYTTKYDIFAEISQHLASFYQDVQNIRRVFEIDLLSTFEMQQLIESNPLTNEKSGILQSFIKQSSILTQIDDINFLKSLFTKKIDSTQLLFKASEHKFSIKTYYQICGNATDTMIICKTNKDKIIGAYTPLAFNPKFNEVKFVADESCESMIFSVTEQDKFELKDKTKAIRHMPSKNRLQIGNVQFAICDEADTQNCSTFLMNRYYANPKYKDDKESYLKLNGNESLNFKTKEWQVWKIQFHKQD